MLFKNYLIKIYLLAFLCLLPLSIAAQTTATNSTTNEPAALAKKFITQLNSGEYKIARKFFDKKMLSALDTASLKQTWETVNKQAGKYKKVLHTESREQQGYLQVISSSQFENAIIDIILVFNTDNKIAGLFFKPSNYKPDSASIKKQAKLMQSDNWTQESIEFGNKEWLLSGTLTSPKNVASAPIAILVHGSGPHDQDSTIGPNKPFRDIAHGLAEHGIASIRYDKRTKTYGAKMANSIDSISTYEETVDDVIYAVKFAQQSKNITSEKVFVIGHSLGGMLIPRIAKENADITGFVMLAAPARPMEELILEQYRYIFQLNGEVDKEEKKTLETLTKQIENVKKLSKENAMSNKDLPLGLHSTYWLDLKNYDVIHSAKTMQRPLLILQGGRDYQVLAKKDFSLFKKELKQDNVQLKLYPELNHLMIAGKETSTPDEYNILGSVDNTLIKDLAYWIKQH